MITPCFRNDGACFKQRGVLLHESNSADEAMDLLKQERPDIILSDYHMPDVDGFAFRQNLIAIPEYKDIPFMFLTSEDDNELMLKGINLEAVDYILKDTPLPVVVSKINNFLSTVREQHERTLKGAERGRYGP
jgi:sigma-B regulation protein RsbU (phosphoserine phosphatase)